MEMKGNVKNETEVKRKMILEVIVLPTLPPGEGGPGWLL
jgi:hypothetical protein